MLFWFVELQLNESSGRWTEYYHYLSTTFEILTYEWIYLNIIIKESINSAIEIKTVVVDFTEYQSIYSKLRTELRGIQIGMLVNNVGMATDYRVRFDKIEENEVRSIVNCNVMSMARICHIVLPPMIQRKSGVIIHIGSLVSALPTIYGSTKVILFKENQEMFYINP